MPKAMTKIQQRQIDCDICVFQRKSQVIVAKLFEVIILYIDHCQKKRNTHTRQRQRRVNIKEKGEKKDSSLYRS